MSDAKSSGNYALNLVFLVSVGVGCLYWVGYHTEMLAVIGGLLGLGGVFAWVAFVGKLIHDDRTKLLQKSFDEWLSRPRTTIYCILVFAALLIAGGLFGSIQLDTRRDTTDRYVEIQEPGAEKAKRAYRAELVAARSVRKIPVFVGFGGRDYEIHVDGLPVLQIRARRYTRIVVLSPDAFLRKNIVLLRPDSELSQSLRNQKTSPELIISIGGHDDPRHIIRVPNYRGESIWIGCDETVAIPTRLQEAWRLELLAQKSPQANMLPWLSPLAVAQELELVRGESIEITIGYPGQLPLVTKVALVEHCGRAACFPQELVLKILDETEAEQA